MSELEEFFKSFKVQTSRKTTYNWAEIEQKIKAFNEKHGPITVGQVHQLFAKDVPYRNEVRSWMERAVNRGILVRWPPRQVGVQYKRVFYVHIDVYNKYLENKRKSK